MPLPSDHQGEGSVSVYFLPDADHMEDVTWYGQQLQSIMHYIPRSRGGLGSRRTVHWDVRVTMRMLDNGDEGRRAEMLQLFKDATCRIIIRTGARMP